jgi:excinuclease UvrABC helicase subunit UvrB
MKFLKKIFSLKEIRKTKNLKKLYSGDKINIYTPNGFYTSIGGEKYKDQVITITIFNNDPISKKIWFYQNVEGNQISFVKSYESEIFRDFILLNIKNEHKIKNKNKSKKDLEKEMQNAINKENYELANLLNEEIKKLENASN